MISDVLSDAVHDLNSYLNDSLYDAVYTGELRERILRCRAEMDAIRAILDTPPQMPEYEALLPGVLQVPKE